MSVVKTNYHVGGCMWKYFIRYHKPRTRKLMIHIGEGHPSQFDNLLHDNKILLNIINMLWYLSLTYDMHIIQFNILSYV